MMGQLNFERSLIWQRRRSKQRSSALAVREQKSNEQGQSPSAIASSSLEARASLPPRDRLEVGRMQDEIRYAIPDFLGLGSSVSWL